jgi:hypothetical protein
MGQSISPVLHQNDMERDKLEKTKEKEFVQKDGSKICQENQW